MSRVVEKEGDSVERAVEAALVELGVGRDEVDVEILEEEETKGFLGIKRGGRAVVRVSLTGHAGTADTAEAAANLQKAGEEVLSLMGLSGSVSVSEMEEGGLQAEMIGEQDDLAVLIGRHGQTLEALQVLLGVITNRGAKDRTRVTLDIEGYRQRRRDELEALADRVAGKAISTGQPVVLRPMTPFERKVVHVALHENPDVETRSDGEEPYRRITVEPLG